MFSEQIPNWQQPVEHSGEAEQAELRVLGVNEESLGDSSWSLRARVNRHIKSKNFINL